MQLIKPGRYQNKLLLVIIGSLIILFLAWNLAFKKTLFVYRSVREYTATVNSLEQISSKKIELQKKIDQLNSFLGIEKEKKQADEIFEELVAICRKYEDIRVLNYPDIHQKDVGGYRVATVIVVLEGNYSDLLKITHELEKNSKVGKLVSVDFKKNKDIKKGKEFLSLTIILQNYELINT